jgi:hypothetical protein
MHLSTETRASGCDVGSGDRVTVLEFLPDVPRPDGCECVARVELDSSIQRSTLRAFERLERGMQTTMAYCRLLDGTLALFEVIRLPEQGSEQAFESSLTCPGPGSRKTANTANVLSRSPQYAIVVAFLVRVAQTHVKLNAGCWSRAQHEQRIRIRRVARIWQDLQHRSPIATVHIATRCSCLGRRTHRKRVGPVLPLIKLLAQANSLRQIELATTRALQGRLEWDPRRLLTGSSRGQFQSRQVQLSSREGGQVLLVAIDSQQAAA